MGICCVSLDFEPITSFDIRVNPVVRHKFVGKELQFPFTGTQIRQEKVFGEVAHKLLKYLTPDTLVVGHAFDNDARMLIDACHKYRIVCPEFDYIDTNTLCNAAFKETGERSLTKIAEKFEIEFRAHDPLEDARATLEVAKKITKGNICGFLSEYGIEPSRLKNSLIYKGSLQSADDTARERTRRLNVPFLKGNSLVAPEDLYFIEPAILTGQDIKPLFDALIQKNYGFTSTPFSADVQVTNNLILDAGPKAILLRTLVKDLGLSAFGFDFTPKKIRGAGNKPCTADEYYRCAYEHMYKDGILDGQGVSFSKAVEQSLAFETLLSAIVQNGGKICFNVADSDIFIVLDRAELKSRIDGRIRAYRRTRTQKVMTADELCQLIGTVSI